MISKCFSKQEKYKNNKKPFFASKLQDVVKCDSCGSPQCMYSNNVVGYKEGTIQNQFNIIDLRLENGYACGNKVSVEDFCAEKAYVW